MMKEIKILSHLLSSKCDFCIKNLFGFDLGTKRVVLFLCLISTFNAFSQAPFITTWKTDNIGVSNNNQITISTSGPGYNYDVYWELVSDSNVNGIVTGQTGNCTITFPFADTFKIEISGSFPRIAMAGSSTDRKKLLTIEQWGGIQWTTFLEAFSGCSNMTYNAVDTPDLSNVTVLRSIFFGCTNFNGNINNWNVSNVVNLSSSFYGANSFDQPLNNWDVSNVTNLHSTFYGASSFNQPLDNWNISNVTTLNSTFYGASSFNQDISGWDVSNVTNMNNTFRNASSFNQAIGNWQAEPIGMSHMFRGATSFNQNLNNWDVSNVTLLSGVFYGATSFNGDIGAWDVSSVGQLYETFRNATSFNQDISGWNVSNVYALNSAFRGATSFNQNIGLWNISGLVGSASAVTDCFRDATSFDQNLGSWDMSGVSNLSGFFQNTGLSFCNYDAILNAWSQQSLNWGVSLNADGINYSSMSSSFRQTLINTFNWSIIDAGQISFSATIQDITCFNDNNGEINLSTNYSGSLNYAWTGPNGYTGTGPTINNLEQGNYQVTVTDNNNCTIVENYQISEPAELVLNLNSINDNLCFGDFNGSIDLSALGGTGNITYDWTGPNGYTGTGATISNLEQGNYVVTATDDNNCIISGNYQITEPIELVLSLNNTNNNLCYGDFNGSIDLSASGGTGNISYAWTGPNGYTGTGATISNLEQGNYVVTVTDDNNCIISGNYQITDPVELVLSLNNINDVSCYGDFNGSIDVSASGGTGSISYEWTGPNGYTGVGSIIDNLPHGVYNVIVTDDNNCTSIENYSIIEPPELEVSGIVDGVDINTTINGGTPPYSFSWTGPNGFTSSQQNVSVFENGVYQVVVEDNNNCPEVIEEFVVTTVSLDNIENDFLFNLYPNPTRNNLNIEFYYQNEILLKIYASDGRKVGEYSMLKSDGQTQKVNLDLSRLNTGIYIYSILDTTNMNTLKVGKIVKE